ncbi:hypothetical protein SNR37_002778 [Agarivorans aestuarii]|uniref:Uncharacterized protein n=1 Tax=Agarivorans aestuarii TaxID=1563703 RepID=A0ABU7G255_9ALTE|nr:hypothetical protein [Agarivorans aestuarii]MEE1673355.1 hypothetical protein [Agarivorans aestuarii]
MDIERLTKHLSLDSQQINQFTQLEQRYNRLMDDLFGFEGDGKQMWKAMRELLKEKDQEITKLLSDSQTKSYFNLKQLQSQQRKQAN